MTTSHPTTVRRGDRPATAGTQGRASAWVAFLLGVVVSVAANVAHTWHPAVATLRAYAAVHHGSAAGWRPGIGAQTAAAFYPCALLLTMELLTRVRWPAGMAWVAARFGGTTVIAGVAAVVSYRHMAGLLAAYGEDALTARIGPLAVDGLMIVASFALLAVTRDRPRPDPADPTTTDTRTADLTDTAIPTTANAAANADTAPDIATPDTTSARTDMSGGGGRGAEPTRRPLARTPGRTNRPTPADHGHDDRTAAGPPSADVGPASPGSGPANPADTRARASALLAQRPDMTGRQLADALGLSERHGQRLAKQVRRPAVIEHSNGHHPGGG